MMVDSAFEEASRAVQQAKSLASVEAEHAIVGGLLLNNNLLDAVADKLRAEHFADPVCSAVYAEILAQTSAGRMADLITVCEATGISLADVNAMTTFAPSFGNMARYADLVIDRFLSRQLLDAANTISDLARDTARPIEDRLSEAQSNLEALHVDADEDDWSEIYEGLIQHADVLEERIDGGDQGWSTGLAALDGMLSGGGFTAGQLVILAARPSMGKTALALNIALHQARTGPVGFLSLEMPMRELRDRQIASLGRVSLSDVRTPKDLDFGRVSDAVELSKRLKFFAQDKSALSLQQISMRARKLKRKHGLQLLVIDYLGLMKTRESGNRSSDMGEISRGLKSLAKELNITVMALAQLNRDVEKRTNGRPILSDLRDSGEIEQDADIAIFVHREEHARPDSGPQWKGHAEVIVAKQRQGTTGTVNATYVGNQTRFDDWHGAAPTNGGGGSGGAKPRGMM